MVIVYETSVFNSTKDKIVTFSLSFNNIRDLKEHVFFLFPSMIAEQLKDDIYVLYYRE